MNDLIEFLRAREQGARLHAETLRTMAAALPPDAGKLLTETADWMLREVEAKRRLLDWLDETERFMDRDDMSWHRLAGEADVDHARGLLALPHADHPDYREEWRP